MDWSLLNHQSYWSVYKKKRNTDLLPQFHLQCLVECWARQSLYHLYQEDHPCHLVPVLNEISGNADNQMNTCFHSNSIYSNTILYFQHQGIYVGFICL